MKKHYVAFAAFIFLLASANAVPRGAQELVPCGHWVYDALTALSLESRSLNFADSAPISIQRLRIILSEIDYDALSDVGRTQYDRIVAYCSEENWSIASDLLSVGFEPTFNPEGFYKTNDDIDWTFDRYSRKGLIEVPVTIGVGDYVSMSATMALQENKGASLHDDNYSNIPLSADDIDTNFPSSAYFSAGKALTEKSGVSFTMNQGTQSIGRTQGGSIIWSDYMTGATTA